MATKYRNGYRTAVSVGKDEAGKRQYIYFEGKTADEADYLALEYKVKHKKKTRPSDMTLDEALDNYIKEKDAILSPATIRGYEQLRKNAYATIIDKKLKDITQTDVQILINDYSRNHKPKSVHNAHGFLSVVMKRFNPDFVLRTKLPKKIKPSIKIPSDKELKVILETAKNTDETLNMEIPIMLAAFTSVRRSEMRGIKVKDIDFKSGQINISRAVVADNHNDWIEKGTKTYDSKRAVMLPDEVSKTIKVFIKERDLGDDDFLITCTPNVITKRMRKICTMAGIQEYTYHELRHYFASKLHALAIPDQYAIKRTGHKTTHMLKNVYQHIMEESEKDYNNKIKGNFDDIIGGA